MRSKIFSPLLSLFSALFSSLLLILSFPDFDMQFLAWIALVPLFIAIRNKSLKSAFALSFLAGVVFFTVFFRWVLNFPGFRVLHQSILGIHVGLYFGLFALAWRFIYRRLGAAAALFAAPFLWVPLEYIRSNLFFMALPFGLLGHSQYEFLPIIQIASIAGVYGVSFLIVLANCGFFALLLSLYPALQMASFPQRRAISTAGRNVVLVTGATLIGLSVAYGYAGLARKTESKGIRTSVIQGNIEPRRKRDPSYGKFMMKMFAELTREAARDKPELIVWPEGSTPRSISIDRRLYDQVSKIAAEAGAFLLLGSSQHQKMVDRKTKQPKFHNSAHLISPVMSEKNQRYDKVRLLPFGEYIPLEGIIPWSRLEVPNLTSYVPGKKFTILECPSFRFGVAICWESLFPDIAREFVREGAQFLVNITNEAGFGDTAAPHQFLSMNVFRPVENRVYMVRCSNTGISCIIDPYGRIVHRVTDDQGDDTFVRGVMTGTVIPMDSRTVYNRYGDWLVWVSFVVSSIFLLTAFFRKHEGSHEYMNKGMSSNAGTSR